MKPDNWEFKIDTEKLSDRLGVPVVALSAKYGGGYWQAYETICHALKEAPIPATPLLRPLLPEIDPEAIAPLVADTVTFPSGAVRRLTEQFGLLVAASPVGTPPLFLRGYTLSFKWCGC